MDDQSITIIAYIVVLLLTLFGRKKKTIDEEETCDSPDVIEARRRIEALKRQRNAPNLHVHETQSVQTLKPVKRNFSAYKHLPKWDDITEKALSENVELPLPKIISASSSENVMQKNIDPKRSKLQQWIIGQVILDQPAFRKNYGSFFNR